MDSVVTATTRIPRAKMDDGHRRGSGQEDLVIKPKKLANPVKESKVRQNLHRELLFNQKMGIEVLNRKTELQRTMEKVLKHPNPPTAVPPSSAPQQSEFLKVLESRKKLIEDNHYFVGGGGTNNN